MRTPKVNESHPSSFLDRVTGDEYLRKDIVIWQINQVTKAAIKNFKEAREEFVADQVYMGEDIDVRFEKDYTKKVAKNMKILADTISLNISKS